MAKTKSQPAVQMNNRRASDASLYPELRESTKPRSALERWLPLVIAFVLSVAVYFPTFDNGFVSWDDDHYLYDNHQVHYWDGIGSIWGDVYKHADRERFGGNRQEDRVSHQYYPVVFTLYWIEFRFHQWFGDADPDKTIAENIDDGRMTAGSFHVVSAVLHGVNAVVLILLLRMLGFSNWVSWAAALLFALHPMQVASVAWAAERKNIISLLFYMLTIMSYVRLRRRTPEFMANPNGLWSWLLRFGLALVLYQAALFSKTVSLTLPVMLFFTDRLLEQQSIPRHRKPLAMMTFTLIMLIPLFVVRMGLKGSGAAIIAVIVVVVAVMFLYIWPPHLILRSYARIAPFVLLSGIAAMITMEVENRNRPVPLDDSMRPAIIGSALWWYPTQMLAPVDQSPIYQLWKEPEGGFPWYWQVPIWGALLVGLALVYFHDRVGQYALWALLLYVITQAPMLGFKNINYFQFAYVADHYFYHGSVGLFILCALGLDWLKRILARFAFAPPATGRIAANALLVVLCLAAGAKTFAYSDTWQDADTFWKVTLQENENCWPGWYNTANAMVRQAENEDDPAKRRELLEEAVRRYRKVTEIHRVITQPFNNAIRICFQQLHDWEAAYELAKEANERWPNFPDYQVDVGHALINLDRPQMALPYLQMALRRVPNDLACNIYLADALFKVGRPCDAIAPSERAYSITAKRGTPSPQLERQVAALREACEQQKQRNRQ